MKTKEERCKYNAARHYPQFKTACVFVEQVFSDLALPPHISFFRQDMNEKTCKQCKCFEDAADA